MDNSIWEEYKKAPTPELKGKIVENYLNLVKYVVRRTGFKKTNVLDDDDYVQFGIEGLYEAIDRFDYNYGVKFETYAIRRIKGKIIDEMRKLSLYLKRGYNMVSLSNTAQACDELSCELYEMLPVYINDPEELFNINEMKSVVTNAIKQLDERKRLFLHLYYYEGFRHTEIAEILGVCDARVTQLHQQIITILKWSLRAWMQN